MDWYGGTLIFYEDKSCWNEIHRIDGLSFHTAYDLVAAQHPDIVAMYHPFPINLYGEQDSKKNPCVPEAGTLGRSS